MRASQGWAKLKKKSETKMFWARCRQAAYTISYSTSFLFLLSIQCLELTSSMVELACLTHIRTWRWLLGLLIRECSVGKTQDQCPLQLSGTIHKANWCRGTTGMKWTTKLLVVVELQDLPSKATNKVRVESTSAEWMFQGTTWRACLFALVSAARASVITLL